MKTPFTITTDFTFPPVVFMIIRIFLIGIVFTRVIFVILFEIMFLHIDPGRTVRTDIPV